MIQYLSYLRMLPLSKFSWYIRKVTGPWFPIKTLEDAKTLYEENYAREYKKMRGYRYAVCLKTDNIPVGYVHVSIDDSYDLGYGLRLKINRSVSKIGVLFNLMSSSPSSIPYSVMSMCM